MQTRNLIAGQWVGSDTTFPVLDKFTHREVCRVAAASREQVRAAVAALKVSAGNGPPPPAERAQTLARAAELLKERKDAFIQTMVTEAGFTVTDAAGEHARAIITLGLCATEATRLAGEIVPFGASPGAHERIGFTIRYPLGIVCAITPFNAPLNTVLHKVGPAYAAGNAVLLKPSALTPLTSALLGETLLDAGMPPGFLAITQGEGDTVGQWLLEEEDIDFYTFTGSTRVGRIIQRAAGLRRTQMELGSIASTIVCASANLDAAAEKIANAAFRKAGQVCTSVQRLYVHESVADSFTEKLASWAGKLPAGDPRDPDIRVGPMISEAAAKRSEEWMISAAEQGAKILCGGKRQGSVITPTVMVNVPDDAQVWCSEAFAPVIAVKPFLDFAAAVDGANSTPYGLSAGVFSNDMSECLYAAKNLRFGTVQLNESSSARSDVMPFGGVKDSGFGKEGPAYAAREMTEERLIIFNP